MISVKIILPLSILCFSVHVHSEYKGGYISVVVVLYSILLTYFSC